MDDEMPTAEPEEAVCTSSLEDGDPPDAALLHRFQTVQDPAAFTALVRRHGPLVLNVCQRVLQNAHDAEDAFQATFLVLVRKARSISKNASLGSWLYKVAYRIAIRARRSAMRRYTQEMLAARVPVIEADPLREWYELEPVLDEEVHRLPEKYRAPFVLCYLQGKTYDEVAQELNCPKGTVSTRLTHARERLRDCLVRRGVVLGTGAMAFELARQSGMAAVPAPLLASTTQAAVQFAAGPLAAGALSAQTAALTQGALYGLWVAQVKIVAGAVLAAALLGAGTGAVVYRQAHRSSGPSDRASTSRVPGPPVAADRAAETDSDRLAGTWSIISWTTGRGPLPLTPDDKLVIACPSVTVISGGSVEELTTALDETKTPKQCTLTLRSGETLTVCQTRAPDPRPIEFSTREGAAWPQLLVARKQ
jgi:RNA polymerase sigma factor (sigma-70 family)